MTRVGEGLSIRVLAEAGDSTLAFQAVVINEDGSMSESLNYSTMAVKGATTRKSPALRRQLSCPGRIDRTVAAGRAGHGYHLGVWGDAVVFYWAGHGKKEGDGHFLATKNSPSFGLSGYNAFRPSELGSMAAKSPAEKVLILLDTCYSGAGAGEIANRVRDVLATQPEQPGRWPAYAVIASAHPLKKAQEASFCKALAQVLSQPVMRSITQILFSFDSGSFETDGIN
jgi:hypothetical protein